MASTNFIIPGLRAGEIMTIGGRGADDFIRRLLAYAPDRLVASRMQGAGGLWNGGRHARLHAEYDVTFTRGPEIREQMREAGKAQILCFPKSGPARTHWRHIAEMDLETFGGTRARVLRISGRDTFGYQFVFDGQQLRYEPVEATI